ncbi:MAG TPA: acetoacetate decarboxylase family protein [Rhizomicrobium sp.]|jgi:hypothetical protein
MNPPLVITGNRIDALGPLNLYGAMLHSFCVSADQGKIQSLLDKTFHAPSGGAVRYEAIGDKVFLSFAEIDRIVVLDALERDHGSSSEIDVTIWVMARRLDEEGAALRFIPVYLFVDNGPAMASGREVWGFPKQLGQFDFTPQPVNRGAARTFKVNGYVLSPFQPTSRAGWQPLCGVQPDTPTGDPENILTSLEALAEKVATRLTDGFMEMAVKLQTALGAGAVTMAFLKQFPDAANPMTACYQAIIEAQSRVLTLRGAGLTDDSYRLQLNSYASLPFFDELGIAPGWQSVGKGIWVDFDFALDLGREIWRAR